MVRPLKEGLDYFSVDIDWETDQRIEYLEAKHGIVGSAIFFKILTRIYKNGYYMFWDERDTVIFAKRINVNLNECSSIIDDCLVDGLFSKNLYKKCQILTSMRIQKQFIKGTTRRQSTNFIKEHLLINPERHKKETQIIEYFDINGVSVDIKDIKVFLNSIKDNAGTQSKVKESKEKGKEKDNEKISFREFITLTPEEHKKLIDAHGLEDVNSFLEILNNYKGSHGKTYKSDYLTILNWVVKRLKEEKQKGEHGRYDGLNDI